MSSIESRKTCSTRSGCDAPRERRGFPVVPTLLGALVVVNVASVVLTLIE